MGPRTTSPLRRITSLGAGPAATDPDNHPVKLQEFANPMKLHDFINPIGIITSGTDPYGTHVDELIMLNYVINP